LERKPGTLYTLWQNLFSSQKYCNAGSGVGRDRGNVLAIEEKSPREEVVSSAPPAAFVILVELTVKAVLEFLNHLWGIGTE
jgi:hypothetical protein